MSLRVISSGLYTIVVDFGRPRTRSLGVPVGGAADRTALAIGNSLVGNPPDAAALEMTLAGPTLEADCDLACVVYGAPFEVEVANESSHAAADPLTPNPSPARGEGRKKVVAAKTFTLHCGEQLRIGGTRIGARAYLCVHGGLQVPEILGSRSGLAPVQAGDVLPCQPASVRSAFARIDWLRDCELGSDDVHHWTRIDQVPPSHAVTWLRILPGPQSDWFPPREVPPMTDWGEVGQLEERPFEVTTASNRMGLRLQGPPLPVPDRELVSEPVCPGSVQVTRDGQCIILGVDGQTIGGYPKIAQVIGVDVDRLGQLRPGDTVRFQPVSLDQAEWLAHLHRQELRHWTLRLRTAAGISV